MITTNLKGEKLSKNDLQIHLIGTLDELNAYLGLVKVKVQDEVYIKFLETIQINIMKIMSHVSDADNKEYCFTEKEIAELVKQTENLKKKFSGELKFVLPGKNQNEAFVHIARTVARRAERCFAAVSEQTPLCKNAGTYLNKLSNYLFYLSFIV